MSEVVRFPGITRLDIAPDTILEAAVGKLEGVIIVGYDKEGNEYFAASYADGGDTLWLLERCKHHLMKIANGE